MPDEDAPQDTGQENADGFKAITSQAAFDAMVKDRLARERGKFADYEDLKARAALFDEREQAGKSEAEKTAERLAALESDLEKSRTEALRARVQAKFKLDDDDAALFLTATDEETLTKQAERLAARAATRTATSTNPLAGRTKTSGSGDTLRDFTRGLFGRDD